MGSIEKLINRLTTANGPVAYEEVERVLSHFGYKRTRVSGSHFHFDKPGELSISFPVHNRKVKNWYVRDIMKRLTKINHEKR